MTSCFFTCGTGPVDDDDSNRPECKDSPDKRRWSFRKRSSRYQELSNPESPFTINKEHPESVGVGFHSPKSRSASEKISARQRTHESIPLSTLMNSEVPDPILPTSNASKTESFNSTEYASKIDPLAATTENGCKIDPNLHESAAKVIQAAIRSFLAQRALLKHKYAVKLQAAVRGHLVRRQAVGTLRCAQAIFKIQALVRARSARLSLEGSVGEASIRQKHEKNNEKGNLGTKANTNCSSIEKILSNDFTRQLLESSAKDKRIQIKCDLSRTDSSWEWFERWMSLYSSKISHSRKSECDPENDEKVRKIDTTTSGADSVFSIEMISAELESNNRDTTRPAEDEENLETYDADNRDFQFLNPTSSARDDVERHWQEDIHLHDSHESTLHERQSDASSIILEIIHVVTDDDGQDQDQPTESVSSKNSNTEVKLDASSQKTVEIIPGVTHVESEQQEQSTENVFIKTLETKGNKLMFGSGKTHNPSFVAAVTKSEQSTEQEQSMGIEQQEQSKESVSTKTMVAEGNKLMSGSGKACNPSSVAAVTKFEQSTEPKKSTRSEQQEQYKESVSTKILEIESNKFLSGSGKACNPSFVAAVTKFEQSTEQEKSTKIEQQEHSGENVATKILETKGNRLMSESGTSFVAAVAKFEEPSTTDTSSRPNNCENQIVEVESKKCTNDLGAADNLISRDPQIYGGGSVCSIEVSVSSALDSPENSDEEIEISSDNAVKAISDLNDTTDSASNLGNLDVEAKNDFSITKPYSPNLQNLYEEPRNDFSTSDPTSFESLDVKSVADIQMKLDSVEKHQKACKSSPEGSPRSLTTASKLNETPPAEVSVKPKMKKLDKTGPTQNKKMKSADKKSPSKPDLSSDIRTADEKLPKDSDSGKRRVLLGSVRSVNVHQDKQSGTDTLPSYMQATQSAKAKTNVNTSPVPSLTPDVQDLEIDAKRRHSIPGATGKQGSPRVPQVQQGAKGNRAHSPR
ncbi:hypothetical protein GIB67_019505 [Kingdonia uniflora]|uniref:DUF4005 domain-containing protein n=1 Tax=Kingdonia uniflora TaxID=39325 RepID=A0A7J7N052_9MAGN|nr:hypothetical protein GIB67_019505 [Kingdonia uniflora]